jgi:hypothetical protein
MRKVLIFCVVACILSIPAIIGFVLGNTDGRSRVLRVQREDIQREEITLTIYGVSTQKFGVEGYSNDTGR